MKATEKTDTLPTLDDIVTGWRKRGREADDPEVVAEIMAVVQTHIGMGHNDLKIMEALDCTPSELRNLKEKLLKTETQALHNRTAEETFLDYKWRMMAVVDSLETISASASKARQFNAAMGAQKAKAQVIDTIMTRGQDMGLINRAAKRTEVVGGMVVAHLDGAELLDAVKTAVASTTRMLADYSDISMDMVDSGDVYFDEVEPEPIVIKEVKAKPKPAGGSVVRVRGK